MKGPAQINGHEWELKGAEGKLQEMKGQRETEGNDGKRGN